MAGLAEEDAVAWIMLAMGKASLGPDVVGMELLGGVAHRAGVVVFFTDRFPPGRILLHCHELEHGELFGSSFGFGLKHSIVCASLSRIFVEFAEMTKRHLRQLIYFQSLH